jgi:hypothetical protein
MSWPRNSDKCKEEEKRRALEQERLWARERRADAMSARQGFNIVKKGFA